LLEQPALVVAALRANMAETPYPPVN